MTAETDNLRAGLQWAAGARFGPGAAFCGGLAEFWSQRQQLSEGRQWLEQLLPRLAAVEAQLQPEQMAQYA